MADSLDPQTKGRRRRAVPLALLALGGLGSFTATGFVGLSGGAVPSPPRPSFEGARGADAAGFAESAAQAAASGSNRVGPGYGAGALMVLGVAGAFFAASGRSESLTVMYGRHDRTTKRGMRHEGKWGNVRLQWTAAYWLKMWKRGEYTVDDVLAKEKPQEEQTYDMENLLQNPMLEYTDEFRDAYGQYQEELYNHMREDGVWQINKGYKGDQWAYKNWEPPADHRPQEEVREEYKQGVIKKYDADVAHWLDYRPIYR